MKLPSRWGDRVFSPWFETAGEALEFIKWTLTVRLFHSVPFTAQRNFRDWIHYTRCVSPTEYVRTRLSSPHPSISCHWKDIQQSNILVNRFVADNSGDVRAGVSENTRLVYALFDFDLSVAFPLLSRPDECRLPAYRSVEGGSNQPRDTAQGELDYDPFAFDVGCLGIIFCRTFKVYTHFYCISLPSLTSGSGFSPYYPHACTLV